MERVGSTDERRPGALTWGIWRSGPGQWKQQVEAAVVQMVGVSAGGADRWWASVQVVQIDGGPQ
jgi:hypothetical protein